MANDTMDLIKRLFKDPYTTMSETQLKEEGYQPIGRDKWLISTGHNGREDLRVPEWVPNRSNILLSIENRIDDLNSRYIFCGSATFQGMYGFAQEEINVNGIDTSDYAEREGQPGLLARFQLHSPYFKKGIIFKDLVEYPIIPLNFPILNNQGKSVKLDHFIDIDLRPDLKKDDADVIVDKSFFKKYDLFQ